MTQATSAGQVDGQDTALIQRAYRNLLKCMPGPLDKEDRHNIRTAFELKLSETREMTIRIEREPPAPGGRGSRLAATEEQQES